MAGQKFVPFSNLLAQGPAYPAGVSGGVQAGGNPSPLEVTSQESISYVSLEHFSVELLASLEFEPEPESAAVVHEPVAVALPKDLKWPPLAAGNSQPQEKPALSKKQRLETIEMLLQCLKRSVVGSALSFSGLRSFLENEIDDMWTGQELELNKLWEAFQEITFLTKPMLLATFAQLYESRDLSPVPLQFPPNLQQQIQQASAAARRHKRFHPPTKELSEPIAEIPPLPEATGTANAFALPDDIWDNLDSWGKSELEEQPAKKAQTSTSEKSGSPLLWVGVAVAVLAVVFYLL